MKYQFEDLIVWQKGMELVEQAYSLTKKFPKDEQFGLISQMRRSAVSVPANIAEGKGRYHSKEFIHFLYTSRGSLYELMTLTKLSRKLDYMTEKDVDKLLILCWHISGGLNGLINSIK